jgi:hypothetical protein
MSLREDITLAIVDALWKIEQPKPILVTREPFEPEKLAITQFPAILIQMLEEERETITMGATQVGRRSGVVRYNIRGFLRGVELDSQRNAMIEAIEQALDESRNLGLRSSGVGDSQITRIEVVNRLAPLAEISITFEVSYNYLRTRP